MIADPKDYQVKPTPDEPITKSDFLSSIKLLLESVRGSDNVATKERAAIEVERLLLEQERLKREMPENKQSPGISVYSYPEGDYARPKAPLKCKMFWVGYEEKLETLTPIEADLLNRLEPGNYRVTKTDGSSIPFTVTAKYTNAGTLEELAVWFPCKKGDDRHNHNSKTSYCQQALGERIPSMDELMTELTRLKMELAMSQVGVGKN